MSALPPKADIGTGPHQLRRRNSGSLEMFAAIRRAVRAVRPALLKRTATRKKLKLFQSQQARREGKGRRELCFALAASWGQNLRPVGWSHKLCPLLG
jgi:hypothetical protein